MSRRLLLIAYYFPPLGGAGSNRALGFARHLPEYGWDVTVLAPAAGVHVRDPELRFCEERVVRTRSFELSRAGKRALRTGGDENSAAAVVGWRRVARDLARALLYFPDPQIGWYPWALRDGRRALASSEFDAVLSTAFPITGHLVGRKLAREFGLPWIADWRDPWSEVLAMEGEPYDRALRMELGLAGDADLLVMPSHYWSKTHSELWKQPVAAVLNGHEFPELLVGEPDAPRVLTYIGTFYPSMQDAEVLWRAAAERGWEVRIVGEPNPVMLAQLEDVGLRTHVTGFLPRSGVLRELRTAGALVVATTPSPTTVGAGAIPSKLFEYLATDRPIIYVGDPTVETARLLDGVPGAFLVAPDDKESATAALDASVGASFPRDARAHTRQARAGELARLLETVPRVTA